MSLAVDLVTESYTTLLLLLPMSRLSTQKDPQDGRVSAIYHVVKSDD